MEFRYEVDNHVMEDIDPEVDFVYGFRTPDQSGFRHFVVGVKSLLKTSTKVPYSGGKMSKIGELAVIAIVVVSVVLCIQYTKRTYYGDDGVVIAAESKPILNEVPLEVKATIAEAHGILDDLLGWGADEEFGTIRLLERGMERM
jgi:hypothetical protein